ncbi:MAG: hypothetical protein M3Z05_10670 [Gemmatimonadota bacterium]|nr:hypothetical protein [Gemmatimonadota bacterium]
MRTNRAHLRLATLSASCFTLLSVAIALLQPQSASAQTVGVHGIFVPSHGTRTWSSGVGTELGNVFSLGPAVLWPAVGFDYQRQHGLGPGRYRITANVHVSPVPSRSAWVTPYVGGGVSANRSGGEQSEWSGTLLGLDAIAGMLVLANGPLAVRVEEQLEYMQRQDHATSTRVGLYFAF